MMPAPSVGHVLARLKQLAASGAPLPAGDRCELCGLAITHEHGHIADLDRRRLLCSCRACFMLFTRGGRGAARFQSVHTRYCRLEPGLLSDVQWDALQIPVGIAFLSFSSSLQRMVAYYPGPAGIAESLLPLDDWAAIAGASPILASVSPDVEAILVRRTRAEHAAYIVPIDACYGLAGRLRATWRGFDGGDDARAGMDRFFAELDSRCEEI